MINQKRKKKRKNKKKLKIIKNKIFNRNKFSNNKMKFLNKILYKQKKVKRKDLCSKILKKLINWNQFILEEILLSHKMKITY